MYKVILPLLAVAAGSLAATPAKPRKHHHPPLAAAATPAHKRSMSVASKTTAKGSRSAARRTVAAKGKAVHKPLRSNQQAPTLDRYKEIQQALATKGYFHGEPNGEWGSESADALKHFQTDQSLMPDGKINSLSLIALGLGPKRLTAKSEATPPPAAPSTPPQ